MNFCIRIIQILNKSIFREYDEVLGDKGSIVVLNEKFQKARLKELGVYSIQNTILLWRKF